MYMIGKQAVELLRKPKQGIHRIQNVLAVNCHLKSEVLHEKYSFPGNGVGWVVGVWCKVPPQI